MLYEVRISESRCPLVVLYLYSVINENIKMNKIIIGLIFYGWASTLLASSFPVNDAPLFAKVVNIVKDDVLNMRSKPDHKSEKTGELYASSIIGVDLCQTTNKSTWCKIGILTNLKEMETGWVNARFLDLNGKHANRGYVKISGRPNLCYYSIKCEPKSGILMCMTANSDFSYTNTNNASIEWTNRDDLHAGTAFDSAPENSDGYCINGKMVDEYYP